jgi:hypothetical protein
MIAMIAIVDDNQLDLFSTVAAAPPPSGESIAPSKLVAGDLDDDALIAAIEPSGMLELVALARESG